MALRRIFIAIDISEAAREAAAKYIEKLRSGFREVRVGWEPPEKLHLTLRFLGETDDDRLIQVSEIVESAIGNCENFVIEIGDTGAFPNTRHARILWLGIRLGERTVIELTTEVESGLQQAGFPREKREFHPHLTIGRIREPQKGRKIAETHMQNKFEPVLFRASGLTLYESKLQKTGSVYVPIRFFPFAHAV